MGGPRPGSLVYTQPENLDDREKDTPLILALQIILVLAAVIMTVFVLLHKGKGGGLSSLFGGGVQSNLSGSTVVEKNLNRYTVLTALIWVACIVALNLLQAYGH